MIFGFLRKNKVSREIAERQYSVLTAAARQPAFYQQADVPDTVMGRFEMLSTVLILYFRRMRQTDAQGKAIAQEIIDAFFQDLDHSMRELGIGDQGVPKRMKKLASMFYGRLDSYSKALDCSDAELLAAALKRNFHPGNDDAALSMRRLADYMIRTEAAFGALDAATLERGEVRFPAMEEADAT